MLHAIPFTIVPLILYNIIAFALGGDPAAEISRVRFSLGLPSGGVLGISFGDILVIVALGALFIEIIKSTRSATSSVTDNLLSMIVFVIYLVEFLLVAACATSTFFILLAIAFLDIITGFAVSVRTARRDIALDRPDLL